MKAPKVKKIFVFMLCVIGMGQVQGHGTEAVEAEPVTHKNSDQLLAQMVRAEERRGLNPLYRYLDNTLANLPLQVTVTELIASVIGKPAWAATGGNPALYGEWSGLTTWPFAFASAANLPDGRILAWGGNHATWFNGGLYTYAAVLDPSTGQITEVDNAQHSMFCGVPVLLEDGRVLVDGGNGASSDYFTSTFDYRTQLWTHKDLDNLAVGRWYNGSVFMANGQVFSALGEPGSNYPELWTEGQGWDYLNGINFQDYVLKFPTLTEPHNWLPHLHLIPDGRIFHSGHTPQINLIETHGDGSIQPTGLTNSWNTANTPSVYYDEGKILQAGGRLFDSLSATGTVVAGKPTTKSELFDVNTGVPSLSLNAEMQYPRIFNNEVVLPNGEVMVIGGNNGTKFSDVQSQLTPEIWSPLTRTWRPMNDLSVPRNYHSVALLMTDGRVWSGGGGLCDCSADHPNSQLFSPPYLYTLDGSLAPRPSITLAPKTVSFGNTVSVTASLDIKRFTLIRMSSTTHALNSDMRFLNIPFVDQGNGQYRLTFNTNRNVLVPGYWMLFALDGAGVPSVAKVINISTSTAPVLTSPDNQNTIKGAPVNLAIAASDPNGDILTYKATGLPTGLSLSPTTGILTGTATTLSNNRVTLLVSDQTNTTSASFTWNVVPDRIAQAGSSVGNSTGSTFVDSVNSAQTLNGIDLYSAEAINGLQSILNTGVLPLHGSPGGNLTTITWPENEYLVRVYGSYGTSIGQISFVTNSGRLLGPYGTGLGNNAQSFDLSAPQGQEITGFTGWASTTLNAIGLIYRSHLNPNHPPYITPLINQNSNLGNAVNLPVIASDTDGDTLTYSAQGLPIGITINPSTGLMTGTPSTTAVSTVSLQVTDGQGGLANSTFQWTVDQNLPLHLNPTSTAPQPINSAISFTASSINGINPRYKWSFGDGQPETAYSSNPTLQHSYTSPGLYLVRVTVTDDRGISQTQTFTQAVHLPHTAKRPVYTSNIVTSANNRLWVINQDNDSVSVFDTTTDAKLAEIPVGKAPRSLAVAPDGKVWVSNKGSSTLSVLNPTTNNVMKTVALPPASQPFGVVFAPDNSGVYVALEAIGKLVKIIPSTGVISASVDVGANPRHLAISQDSSKIYLSRYISPLLPGENTASVQTVDAQGKPVGGEIITLTTSTLAINGTIKIQHSAKEDTDTQGSGVPNYLAMIALSPDGQTGWVPSKQDNILRGLLRNGQDLTFQNSVRAIASKIELVAGVENYPSRIDFDNSGLASAITYDLSGNYLFVALQNTREIAVVDAYGGRELKRIAVGLAPEGLTLSIDGQRLYVNNFLSRTVSVIDLTDLISQGKWQAPVIKTLSSVTTEKLSATVLKGKQLFYDAKDVRLARDGYLSCASCHDDAGHDGRVWDFTGFGEGLRNTIVLKGRRGTGHGLLHWTGNFDEIQDFEGQIRKFAAGTGLMTDTDFTATQAPLGAAKAGLSADLDALAAYLATLNSLPPSPYRNPDGSLTSDAQQGQTLFNSACSQCHQGSDYTDSSNRVLHNVGTLKPSSGRRLNGPLTGLDTPTLRDVWNTAPYLHDGSASSLETAIRAHNTTTSLTDAQIAQLASYVRQIGGDLPPTVALTSPTPGLKINQGLPIALAATASDSEGSVAKVEFYADSTLLATSTVAPYSYNWTNTAVGNYNMTAIAYDNKGIANTSDIVNLTVRAVNQPPEVALNTPINGSTFAPGSTVSITATATDSDGSVAKVEFYAGSTLLATSTVAPYSYNWNNPAVGSYAITLKAYDNKGLVSTSSPIGIVIAANQAPVVNLTAPSPGASYVQGAAIALTATASDSDGSIAKVEFYAGSTLLATSTTAPYSANWTNAVVGSYSLTAIAYDDKGAAITSSPVTLTVTTPNQLPSVTLTAPATATSYELGTAISLAATATDVDGSITKVAFYAGTALISTVTTAPYSYPWTPAALGTYNLTARAYDDRGGVKVSKIAKVTVIPDNQAPTITLTAPVNASNYLVGAPINLAATAADSDGSIAKVEFYAGSTLLATSTTAPYSTSWTNAVVGNYSLTAIAYDNKGKATTSTPVTLTVTAPNQLPSVTLTAPATATSYELGTAINLAATATDADGSINKVAFYSGTTSLAIITTAPYTFNWTPVALGAYSVTARAYDNKGAVKGSKAVQVSVIPVNQAPTIALTAPVNASNYLVGAPINLAATAADSDGSVAKVEFYAGSTLLATSTTAPYSASWTNAVVGSYSLTAVAYDNKGKATTSAPVSVSVTAPNQLPSVTLTAPATATSYELGTAINLAATATDADGSINKVAFYSGTTSLAIITTAPYTFNWTPVALGAYSVTARAYDNKGAVKGSKAVQVSVIPVNQAPNIALTAPVNASNYLVGAPINLAATAADSDGSVAKVEFYAGSTLLATSTTAPYSASWTNAVVGSYSLTAIAYDDKGKATTSTPVSVTVTAPNQLPSVTMTAPVTASSYGIGTAINLAATATDADGSITKVAFYEGTTSLAIITTAPYTFNWTPAALGTYNLTARAYDNKGGVKSSASVKITVVPVN